MAVGIKICGVTDAAAIAAAIAGGASHVGLNFFPPSPRRLTSAAAATLAASAGSEIAKVGVFVDPDDRLLADSVEAAKLDAIQLHGHEPPERAAAIRARYGVPVWKAIAVATTEDVGQAEAYRDAVDFILFDAKPPREAALPGGVGLRFDWSLLDGYRGRTCWGLAGGLSANNVAEAIRATGAPLVDTSSGVESAPGIKQSSKIAAFCSAARRA